MSQPRTIDVQLEDREDGSTDAAPAGGCEYGACYRRNNEGMILETCNFLSVHGGIPGGVLRCEACDS